MDEADIRFACPHCGQHIAAPADMAGETVDCPSCGKPMTVPSPPPKTPPESRPRVASQPVPPSPSASQPPVKRSVRKTVIVAALSAAVLVIVAVGVGVAVMRNRGSVKPPSAEASKPQPTVVQPVPTGSGTNTTLGDDPFYDDTKVKYAEAQSPTQQVELLKAYMAKFPSGKHISEATALIESAEAKAKSPALINVECRVTSQDGQEVPVVGWVQIIESSQGRSLCEAVAQTGARLQEADKAAQIQAFVSVNLMLLKLKPRVVATGKLKHGKVSFPAIPPGDYILYGAGCAGPTGVLYFTPFTAAGGWTVPLSPEPQCAAYSSSDSSAEKLAGGFHPYRPE